MVFYCLNGRGIRVGYPSAKLLHSLTPAARRRIRGRAILILTSNHRYALEGVRPDSRLAPVARLLHAGLGYTIGLNTWYVVPYTRNAVGLLKVRRGEIQEVGIAAKTLTGSRARTRAFLKSFD